MKHARILLLFFVTLCSSSMLAQERKLGIEVASPNGPTITIDQAQLIFVSFNQPMVPLKEVPQGEDVGPMILSPSFRGKYRWLGSSTLAFIPADTLPYATLFSIRIPAGLQSLSGQQLQQDYVWQFETPRPRVVEHRPYSNQQFVELDHLITLFFNQPVDPAAVSKFLSIEERAGNAVTFPSFKARLAQPEELKSYRSGSSAKHTIVIIADQRWKSGATYTLRCKAGLPGVEGSLGMAAEYSFSFSTYPQFSFIRLSNKSVFPPSQSLRLVFSTPVSIKEVAKHLVLEPVVTAQEFSYDYENDQIYLTFLFAANTEYHATILAGLKDRFGQELKENVKFSFRTDSFSPYVRMTTGPGVIEAYESHRYPVRLMNLDSVLVQMGRVNIDRVVPLMQKINYENTEKLAWDEGISDWVDTRPETAEELSSSKVWQLHLPPNKEVTRPIELDEVLGKSSLGIVFLQVDNLRSGDHRRYLKALVEVTNLGITAKFSSENNLVWVTNLKDATPIAGATVEIRNDRNAILWSGQTGSDGLVKTPGWGKFGMAAEENDPEGERRTRQWVLVRYRDEVAFTNSEWNSGIEPWAFGVSTDWSPHFEPLEGSLFTDRGLYKASESVEIKGVVRVRKEGAWKIPTNAPLRLTVTDPRNDELLKENVPLNAFGSFAVSVPLKPEAPLGYYSMTLEQKLPGGGNESWKNISFGQFRVEAFRAAEFDVSAHIEKLKYVIGDTISGFLNAHYLFGAPMKGDPVTWRISVSESNWRPEGFDGYFFNPIQWLSDYSAGYGPRVLLSDQGKLDEGGSIAVRTTLRVGEVRGTVSLLLEGDVTSPSRQVVSGRTSVIVHGGEYYIGIGPSTTFVESDSTLKYNVIAVTPEGKFVPGERLSVKVVQRFWRSVRKAESGGRYVWESTVENVVVDSQEVTSGAAPVERTFRTKQAGFYIIVAEGKDIRGNHILSNAYFYVSGSSYVAWARTNDDKIELVANKTNFVPGETASILVKSPYEQAIALVSLEREGIIHHYVTKLKGSAPQINIPIEKSFLPNIYVSVVLLQGRVAAPGKTKEADVGRPSFKIGYVNLSVSPKEKLLSVDVKTDRKDYRPGDSVLVSINVKSAAGQGVAAEVTLSVADLGVLNLIGYHLPNLFSQFYQERGLAVTTTETRLNLVQQRDYGEKGEDEGGGGGQEKTMATMDAEGVRKDFRPSAYWNPSVLTDTLGRAVVKFKLPDNLTSLFQVMAVGQTIGADFGYAENSFTVSKPLMMLPALPRFARVGDSFEGGTILFNYSSSEKNVRLITEAKGIRFIGKDTAFHVLKPGQALEVRQQFAAEKVGKATFIFRAKTDDDSDGMQWTIPIQVPLPRESAALSGTVTATKSEERVLTPKDAFKELGEIEVAVSSTALVNLEGGMQYLFTYPYGCLEQRVSAVLPMILAKDLVEAFKFEVLKDKDYRSAVNKVLSELPSFQRPNGGFAYWKNSDWSYPYISAYALYAAVQAQRNGYVVDKRMMDSGFEYFSRILRGEATGWTESPAVSNCTKALILYTLALAGKPDYGYMERLYQDEKKISSDNTRLPLFAKAYLLKALSAARGNAAIIQDLARDLTNQAKIASTSAHFEERDVRGMEWIFHSDVRTTALVMQALIETQPENTIIPKVVGWLLAAQRSGRWRTTQENLYVIDALATYFRAYEMQEPNFRAHVKLAGGDLVNKLFQGRTFATARGRVPMSDLVLNAQYPVEIIKEGQGRLYYTMRMNYYPKGESKAREEGLSLLKSIETQKEGTAVVNNVKAGTFLKVTLTVITNQARNYVVVEDPLPAGFETVNLSFQTSASDLSLSDEKRNSDDWWYANPFKHAEMRDDRVLLFADYMPAGVHTYTYVVRATSPGNFQMPPTRAEGMYEPEVFGQTSPRQVKVE